MTFFHACVYQFVIKKVCLNTKNPLYYIIRKNRVLEISKIYQRALFFLESYERQG